MCIIGRSFALIDLKLPRRFDLDLMLLVHQRGFSKMAILYYFSASTGDLARFGQNQFSRPAIYFLVQLFHFNEGFPSKYRTNMPHVTQKIKTAPTDKIWCDSGQSKSILDGSNPPCREFGVSFEPVLDTVFGYICVLSLSKRCAFFAVINVLMSLLVNPKERWPWYFDCEERIRHT